MPKPLRETTPLGEAGTLKSGRMKVCAISAGLGSSGYYSPEVLQEAATNGLIAKGTPLYLDHPSESDRHDRPERSVRDIAAVFTEAASYDATEQALVGEIQVFAPYRELLTEMAPFIGLSISGSATDITEGEVDGNRVPVIEGLAKIDSVDWVTRAGRGGKVVELLESVRVNKRAIAHGVAEATADERRRQLSDAVRSMYGGEDRYAWVQDFDDTTVWFEASAENERSRTWEQAYDVAADDMSVTLAGTRAEVRQVTRYVPVGSTPPPIVPVTRPGSTTTESLKEDTMPHIQIEEAEHTRLVDEAGRVPTLETERDTAVAERDRAIAERDAERRSNRAMNLVREHAHSFSPLEARGLVADLPLTEAGEFDEAAFTTALDKHAAAVETARGAGTVTGFGASTENGGQVTESTKPTASAWGRKIEKGA